MGMGGPSIGAEDRSVEFTAKHHEVIVAAPVGRHVARRHRPKGVNRQLAVADPLATAPVGIPPEIEERESLAQPNQFRLVDIFLPVDQAEGDLALGQAFAVPVVEDRQERRGDAADVEFLQDEPDRAASRGLCEPVVWPRAARTGWPDDPAGGPTEEFSLAEVCRAPSSKSDRASRPSVQLGFVVAAAGQPTIAQPVVCKILLGYFTHTG